MKRLLIINPGNPITSELSALEPPIWAGLYADYAKRHGYDVRIHDCQEHSFNPSEYLIDEAWIIAMGNNPSASSTPKMSEVASISRSLASHCVKVKIGGLHPMALPDETLRECDADYILPMIKVVDHEIAWDLLPMNIYRAHNWHCLHDGSDRGNYASLYTAYGCPFSCDFCNIGQLYGRGIWIPRSIKSVVVEMGRLKADYGIRNLKICDELFTVNPSHRVEHLCEQIEQFGFNIWAYARVGTVNSEMLKAMKRAGVNWLAYGFESFSPEVRGNKKYRDEDEAIRMTRDAGINIMGNFIFGLPGDTQDTMRRTLDRAMNYKFEFVNFYVYMPYPGSLLWKDSYSHDWARYSQFSPNPVASREVAEFKDRAFIEYFTNPNYLNHIEKKFGAYAVQQINSMLASGKPRNREYSVIGG